MHVRHPSLVAFHARPAFPSWLPATALSSFSVRRCRASRASLVGDITSAYERLDRLTAETAAAAPGVRCPPGCGQCCTTPFVEVTEGELLPLVAMLMREGRAEATLARLDAAEASGDTTCIMFERTTPDGSRGRCTVYEQRPGLCRLFGFSGRRAPDGALEWCPCAIMRDSSPAAAAALAQAPPPIMPVISSELAQIRAAAGSPQDQAPMLLNHALRRGLAKEMLRSMYARSVEDGPTMPELLFDEGGGAETKTAMERSAEGVLAGER